MKKFLVLLLVSCCLVYSNDSLRIHRGRWMLSGSASHVVENREYTESHFVRNSIEMEPAYFFNKMFGVGLGVDVVFYRGDYRNRETYLLTPELIIIPPLKALLAVDNIYPYISVGGYYSDSYLLGEQTRNGGAFRSKLGCFIFLNNNIAINPHYLYQYQNVYADSRDDLYSNVTHTLALALQVFLN